MVWNQEGWNSSNGTMGKRIETETRFGGINIDAKNSVLKKTEDEINMSLYMWHCREISVQHFGIHRRSCMSKGLRKPKNLNVGARYICRHPLYVIIQGVIEAYKLVIMLQAWYDIK